MYVYMYVGRRRMMVDPFSISLSLSLSLPPSLSLCRIPALGFGVGLGALFSQTHAVLGLRKWKLAAGLLERGSGHLKSTG